MAPTKSEGSTPSERLLARLCEQTFLGFWSYANTFRDQGGPKELCDLTVVCDNHILLFSDKSCAFPDTGNVKLDWSRWFRKTISESAKPLMGAERWLSQHPDRVYLDNRCTEPLPVSLPDIATCRFHRIVVALGAQERCRQHRGGSGSLSLSPAIIGRAHYDLQDFDVQPFAVGSVGADARYFHVLDDFTLPLILKELDTVTDLVSYLDFKEALFRSNKIGHVAGEENLLGLFLSRYVHTGDWRTLLSEARDGALVHISDGPWELVTETDWYRQSRVVLQPSYIWDHIIQDFAAHAFAGTLVQGSPETVTANEQIFRCMAKEPRWARAFLAAKMYERWTHGTKDRVDYRVVASPSLPDTLYVFVFVPNTFQSVAEYRQTRQQYLRDYSFLVASKHRRHRRVLGIASEAGEEPYRTFDVVILEGHHWTVEMESLAAEIEKELEVTGEGPVHSFTDGATRLPPTRLAPELSGHHLGASRVKVGRNDPCPCGSGKKFKRCCLRRSG